MKAIQIPTSPGRVVLVAVSEQENIESINVQTSGGIIAAGEASARMVQQLEDVGTAIAEVCNSVQQKILGAMGDAKPSELKLAFGLKLVGTAAIPLITSTSIEGTFQVSAKWDFSKK